MRVGWGTLSFVVACAALIGLTLASLIAVRSYRAARLLVEAGPPSPLLQNLPGVNLENLQSITFKSAGSTLSAWYVPSQNRAAVVIAHGVHGDRATMLAEIRLLSAAGFGVLAFDWPGLGASEGPIRWGPEAKEALCAAIDWLAAKPQIDPRRIGGLGFSIGGFVMAQVAAKDARLRAVVIESAATEFDTYIRINYGKWGVLSRWPARWALRDSGLLTPDNSTLPVAGEISPRPLFIIGQTADPVVPASMVEELAAAARPPKQLWLIDGAEHGSFERVAGGEYARRLREFFQANLLGEGNTSASSAAVRSP